MPKITGKRRPEWTEETITLLGDGMPWVGKNGVKVEALCCGQLAIYKTLTAGTRHPDTPAWTLGHRLTSLAILKSDEKDDLVKIGTIVLTYCAEPFEQKTKGAVLRRMPKRWYDWLRACWKAHGWLDPPKLETTEG